MEWYYILLIILSSLLLLYLVMTFIIGLYVVNVLIYPYSYPYEEALEKLSKEKRLNLDDYNLNYKREDFTIKSNLGYTLKATYIPKQVNVEFADKKERAVILVHGWTSSRLAMLIYGNHYLKLGFHVFAYDHRNHMQSDRNFTSMGNLEADDLQTMVEYVKEKFSNNVIIGTHGESMGAATSMIHAGRYHSVDFMCEDCGYNSLKELLAYQIVDLKHLPLYPSINFANLILKLKAKTSLKDLETNKYLSTCDDIPMYFVHGDKDDFVPTYMVYKNYDAKNGFKMINLYKDSIHAHSITKHYEQYGEDLKEFLIKSNIID